MNKYNTMINDSIIVEVKKTANGVSTSELHGYRFINNIIAAAKAERKIYGAKTSIKYSHTCEGWLPVRAAFSLGNIKTVYDFNYI